MSEGGSMRIVEASETIFFGRNPGDGELRQWIDLTIESEHSADRKVEVTIEAGGEKVATHLTVRPGKHAYRAYAKVLWPDLPAEPDALVLLQVAEETARTTVSVGAHRPWIVHVLGDTCSDYTWGVYSEEAAYRADDAALSEAELNLADETASLGPDERSAYNFVHAREIEYILEHHPERVQGAFEMLKQGRFSISPFFNNASTSAQSIEELIRQFYFARRLERDHDVPIQYANHQETPTITWMMATVLAGCGIPCLIRAAFHFQCPWAQRLEEPPLFVWEGPDGSRVLHRRGNDGYTDASFLLALRSRGTTTAEDGCGEGEVSAINAELHEKILPQRETSDYPFRTVALLGSYGDLSPRTPQMPAVKAANLRLYRSQEWDYPKMVDASHEQYWKAIRAEMKARKIELPVYRGDYGCAWDAWPVSLARYFAAWRRAQELAGTADKLITIATVLDPAFHASHSERLRAAWLDLISLADHAWNGANDGNRALNAQLRKDWSDSAVSLFGDLIESALVGIASQITSPESCVMVFNALPWERTSVVELPAADSARTVVRDSVTGEVLPTQPVGDGKLALEARSVPSVGYRLFRVEEGTPPPDAVTIDADTIESPFYRLKLSAKTGAVESLYDKSRDRELVDAASPYDLGQCVYTLDETDHVPEAVKISAGKTGAVFAELIVRSRVETLELKTTFRLYAGLDRVDITHQVERPARLLDGQVRNEPEQLNFAFPFDVPNPQYRFEAPGCIMTPGESGEQLPGSGQAYIVVRHFTDVFNEDVGVTLSQADSGIVQFGHRTQAEDPRDSDTTEAPRDPDTSCATLWCSALGNFVNYTEITRDQAGETNFTFRYSLRGHAGGFNPVEALHFAWEDNNELLSRAVPENNSGRLTGNVRSFASVSPETAILTAMKVADEGPEAGMILRLWNVEAAGQITEAEVDLSGLGRIVSVSGTDLLERDKEELAHEDSGFSLNVRGRGLAASRVTLQKGEPDKCS